MWLVFPSPIQPHGSCWGPGPGPPPSEDPSGRVGPGGVGESRGGRVEANGDEALGIIGLGGTWLTFPPPTRVLAIPGQGTRSHMHAATKEFSCHN